MAVEIGLSAALNAGRFDVGWYAGRIYGLLAASLLLIVLLIENGRHYARLARIEGKYRGLLEAAPDGMVVVNQDGEIVLLNIRAEEQFGYSRDELVGQQVENIIPEGFAERLLADGRRTAAEALAQQIGMGIELYGRRRDGVRFPIEIMLSPLESAEGVLVTAAIRDISVRKDAEKHLAQMEGRYRGLLEAAPDAMVVVNQHDEIVLLNLRAEEQFGYSRDELLGQKVENIIPEGFAERLLADGRRTAAEALAQQIGMGIELYGRRRDGAEFPIEIMLSPLESTDGVLITAAIRDISVRRDAEERLAQMEGRYRGLLEAAPDAMVVVNQDGEIVLLNIRAEEQFGYSRDELLGQKVENIIPEGFAERLIADGRRTAAEALAQQIGMGIELHGRRKDGGEFPIEIMLSPLDSTEGVLVTAAVRDISVRKATQAALHESQERLERAQAIAGLGSWELDLVTGCYIWSKELYRIRGFLPGEFEPNVDNVADYMHPDDDPSTRHWLADLAAGHAPATCEARIIRPNGDVRLLRVEGRPVADADSVIRHLAGTMQDITERRLIEQQLAQAQKMEAIGNLTGGMAHDFNNGLGVIIGNLDLLERLVKADRTATELCDEAREGALRCAERIRLMLAFARRQPLHPQQTDVNALIETTAKPLGRGLGGNITLTQHLAKALWPVMADPAQLEAALTNLVNNARDAMPNGGRLDITTKVAELDAHYVALHPEVKLGEYVLIEVSDTGAGIAPEILGRIFEPFFTTKESEQGTGLGLSMTFGFVKQSNGHLTVYSELGRGSTFRIYLPRAHLSGTPAAAPVAHRLPVVGGSETVLVVEDNARLRRAATRQLVALGYQVREAEHAEAALVILCSGVRVDLLFTDLVMPGTMDGLDLAQRATRLRGDLKILLTSGFPGVRGADQRMAACPFSLLNKPYRHDDLAWAVRKALDSDDDEALVPAMDPFLRSE